MFNHPTICLEVSSQCLEFMSKTSQYLTKFLSECTLMTKNSSFPWWKLGQIFQTNVSILFKYWVKACLIILSKFFRGGHVMWYLLKEALFSRKYLSTVTYLNWPTWDGNKRNSPSEKNVQKWQKFIAIISLSHVK